MIAEDTRHSLQHLVVIERFGDVIHRSHFHRIHRRAQAGVAGHDQHGRAFGQLDQLGTGSAWQTQVADDQIERGNAEALLSFLYRAGFADLVLVALEQSAQGGADNGFVFDDQNMGHQYSLDGLKAAMSGWEPATTDDRSQGFASCRSAAWVCQCGAVSCLHPCLG